MHGKVLVTSGELVRPLFWLTERQYARQSFGQPLQTDLHFASLHYICWPANPSRWTDKLGEKKWHYLQ